MIVVYTAILGGCDSLKPAPKAADLCYCFTDDAACQGQSESVQVDGWYMVPHVQGADVWGEDIWSGRDSRREAWRLRSMVHETLPPHDISVWVDASFTITDLPRLLRDSEGHDLSALKHHKRSTCYEEAEEVVKVKQAEPFEVAEQMAGYRCEGFNPSALSISCIIVRRNNPKVTAFNELWDAEIRKNPGDNTQLSIDYCAWKTGVGVHHLQGVRKDNPYAAHDHSDHKRRRKPYRS